MSGSEVTASDRAHEVSLLREHAGTLPALDLDHSDGEPEHDSHEPDRLEKVRVIGNDDRHLVLPCESVDEQV